MKLDSAVSKLPLVGPSYQRRLEKLNIFTIEDLLLHVPHRYADLSLITKINRAQPGEAVTVRAKLASIKNLYTKSFKNIQIGEIEDDSGKLKVVWFNQPFLVRNFKKGFVYSFSGKIDFFDRAKALNSPDYEAYEDGKKTIHTGRLVPIYPETGGVSSKWLRSKISSALNALQSELEEFLPDDVLESYNLVGYKKAVNNIHFPENLSVSGEARTRLAFNELLSMHIKNLFKKESWNENKPTHELKILEKTYGEFVSSLPFILTNSQSKAIGEILNNLIKDKPMNRLLEGDVGSGKTVVAAAASFAAFVNGYQSVFMAPTQILAQQHFISLKSIFDKFKVRVALITSSDSKKDLGKTDIFVGTHALIHRKVDFDNVALVVIDEQHRFGVEQRAHLVKKVGKTKYAPHVLTMTATPIPRTVALTLYGDLDLSVLNELPKGRRPITTWLVPEQKRIAAYDWIKKQIQDDGIQAFIVCPLIEESSVESMKQVRAATKEVETIQKLLPDLKIGLLHGRQKAQEKNEVLDSFKAKEINILVATPVVEVGIDVPNATIMVVEAAERFGLAQLHQLRGRVGRGEKKSYCLLFTEMSGNKIRTRLSALQKSHSGFELAELDMKLRGPGEMFGLKQHGFTELKIASWQDADLISESKKLAEEVVENKPKFKKLLLKMNYDKIILN